MAIDTANERLSLLSFGDITRPNLYLPMVDGLDQPDQQALLWGYVGNDWSGDGLLRRYYGIRRGGMLPRDVLEASSSTGRAVELRISEHAYLRPMPDVIADVERIRDYLRTKETTPIQ